MQKKLIAVAVGSALGAIGAAPALAQNATVSIYGTLYGEYSRINNGAKTAAATDQYQSYDHWQNPGSELGIRGEEKLGGGLSAWFQCSMSMEYRGSGNASSTNSQAGGTLCTRNSALGMKGGFGNVFYGNWNTPFARVSVAGNTGAQETGIWGNSHLLAGTSTTTGMSAPSQVINNVVAAAPGTVGAATANAAQVNSAQQAVFRRRQNNLLTYETPNFSGFTMMGAVTTRNNASAATQAQLKSRLWSVGAQYANGPFYIGAAYEKHNDFYNLAAAGLATAATAANIAAFTAANAAPIGGEEHAYTISGSYTFSNNLKVGGVFHDIRSNTAVGVVSSVKTWHVGMDWMISGPHGMRAGYTKAGDIGGPLGAAMPTRPAAGPNTSANMWQARYVFQASKRTEFTLGFSRTHNSTGAAYETGGASTAQLAGSNSNAIGAAMQHRF